MGAGLGHYTKFMLKQSKRPCHIFASDGAYGVAEATEGLVRKMDLTVLHTLGVYDWVVSLEVGEHIDRKYEAILLENLVKASRMGIVLSWAVLHQGVPILL